VTEREFAAAGLLDGLEGPERAARVKLLQRLHEGGCTIAQLRESMASGRLELLPVERLLERRRMHTLREAERTAPFPPGFVERNHRAIGLPLPDPDEPVYDDEQVENLTTLLAMMQAGLPEDDLHLLGRILGQSSRRTAEAIVDVLSRALAQPGDTDSDVALRMADFAEAMLPMVPRLTGAVLRLHLLDVVQEEAVAGLESDTGGVAGEREVAVAFADLAGFTALSEEIGIEELGRVAGRFEALVTAVAEPPVRLVKVLGDGAMLVSPDPDALVSAMLALVDAAEGLPPVRAGVAYGPALHSVGDWLGHTVNVAARLCAAAPPRAVIATPQVREAGDGTIAWEDAGTFALRGISEPVAALRARRPRASAAAVR
jgi:adenylate cyclase